MVKSYKWMGMGMGIGYGMGWDGRKSLKGVILRAPLCGAKNITQHARLIKEQKREVSKVLLDGLYDPDSPLSKLLGICTDVMGEIIWQKMLVENWHIFPS